MKIIIKIFLFILITIHFSCRSADQNKEDENNFTASPMADTPKVAEKPFANVHFASKYDTSCGMPLSAGLEDTLHLNDKIYGFCSKECKDDFVNKLKAEKKR